MNRGKSPHDFDFPTLRKGTAYLAPGKAASYKVAFGKPGSYRFVCTVPGHAKLGMVGTKSGEDGRPMRGRSVSAAGIDIRPAT